MSLKMLGFNKGPEEKEAGDAMERSRRADEALRRQKDVGVKNIEVYAAQYDHVAYRVALFFSLFLIAYAYRLDGLVRSKLEAYATDSYGNHSLLSTVNCIKTVMAAGGMVAYARASDMFGRMEMLAISIVLVVVGTIVECQSDTVSKFATGACLYQLGKAGLTLILQVIAVDFSNLNWRMVALYVPALPTIINTWVSGDVISAIGSDWEWGIGMWAFIIPLSCIPLFCCLVHMRYLAHKHAPEQLGKQRQLYSMASWSEYLIEVFFWRLDSVGLILVVGALGCVLVPFTLAGGLSDKWRTAQIIVPEVIGWCVALPLFVLWEAKFARFPLTPRSVLKDRGVIAALVIAFHIHFCVYMQADYMYTVLVIAVHESVKAAQRITTLFNFVSIITGTLLGFVIVYVKRTKKFILFGVCVWFVAFGLLVHFRGDESSHSGIIGALCLLGFGGGFFNYSAQVSMQASTAAHQDLAVVTSLYLACYNIGSAFASAISGAIWTNVLPKELNKRITEKQVATLAYSSPFKFIIKYKWGTPQRVAVVHAYQKVQRILCIVPLCFCVTLLIAAFLLRDKKLSEVVALGELEHGHSESASSTGDAGASHELSSTENELHNESEKSSNTRVQNNPVTA